VSSQAGKVEIGHLHFTDQIRLELIVVPTLSLVMVAFGADVPNMVRCVIFPSHSYHTHSLLMQVFFLHAERVFALT